MLLEKAQQDSIGTPPRRGRARTPRRGAAPKPRSTVTVLEDRELARTVTETRRG